MATYTLHMKIGANSDIPPLTVEASQIADLAAATHRHARGYLAARRVDIRLDHDTLTGKVINSGAVVGTFALQLIEPEPASAEPDAHGVRYGWTLASLDQLARAVVSNNRAWWPAGDRDDLYAAAWHGIVEHLYTADSAPRRTDLMEAGRRALADDVRASMRHHGARRDSSNSGRNYALYWKWAGRAVPSPENAIVERLAIEQILPALTPRQLAAVQALAAAGDYDEAARLFGSESGLKSQLMKGRRRFRALWHEGETPSGHWGCDRRAGKVRGTIGEGSAIARIRRRTRGQPAA
ncbi:hypothetical protein ABZ419_11210 [Streptomyces cinnamoneus]|uniref:hypothetical protein n=1 Tax=Streptomyces cinnamoneus TaxID=53446 RepID=UPI00340B6E26